MSNRKLVVRNLVDFEVRAEGDNTQTISGYALKWNDRYDFFGDGSLVETFKRGAFKEALANKRTALKIEHTGPAIASTQNGTLELSEDKTGLRFEATLDTRDTEANNAYIRTSNGTSQGVSVGFIPQKVSTESKNGDILETVEEVRELREISLVHNPAYESSEVSAREDLLAQRQKEVSDKQAEDDAEREAVEAALTRVRVDRCVNSRKAR